MKIDSYRSLNEFFTSEEIHEQFLKIQDFYNCPIVDCEYCKNKTLKKG